MTPEEAWSGIERVEIDVDAVRSYAREIHFSILGFSLCREVTSWACVAACVIPPTGGWNRNEAVLAGHSVRLFKLLPSLLDQVNAERADLMWVILRMASECAINLRFLIKDLYALHCTTETTCVPMPASDGNDSRETVAIPQPAAGIWKIVVDPFAWVAVR